MAKKKQQTTKRRVSAQKQNERQAARQKAAEVKALRRRQTIVGFLAVALVAPLAFAGFIAASGGDDPAVLIPTTVPTTTIALDWVPSQFAGASVNGPTPCPATDGSAERTTSFTNPPPTCIDPAAVYELTFETAATTQEGVALDPISLIVPVDPALDADAANLVAVFGWYHAYEQTPINAFSPGLIGLGGFGDAGFLVDPTPSGIPLAARYEPGAVLATPFNDGLNGALMIVVDETGQTLLEQTSDFVRVGTITDVEGLVATYEAMSVVDSGDLALIGSVTVTESG
ncbi:MAG: hypothetical protein P8J50_00975 [Acidimicrobiales bacterium]|nr:hypothetical protein [Acidimicrobiales bacterium]